MAELRLNPVTRRWIVTGKRPVMPDVQEADVLCPFCPGNERLTPKAICETRDASGAWTTRVFHDRAPIFQIETPLNPRAEGMYDRMNTLGAHEIVVETPQHGLTMGQLAVEQLAKVVEVYRDRILDLKGDRRFRYVSLFKDQRAVTAALQGHAHSQMLASLVLPRVMQNEFRWSQEHFQKKERCLYCDIIEQEIRQDKRVVDQNPDFIALCPFSSRAPYEMWILPLSHSASFEKDLPDAGRVQSLASFLKNCLERVENLSQLLHIVLHTGPNLEARGWPQGWWSTIAEDFHWHIEITPDIEGERRVFGSEGFYFNPIPAEEATLVLRALGPEAGSPRAE
jgi:UDPglucose--hexose-1-phosphate uridylyltransferase